MKNRYESLINRVSIILLFTCLSLYSNWNSFAVAESSPVEIERSSPVPDAADIKEESVRYITLKECIKIAKENSVEMETTATNLEIAELRLENAKAGYWPHVKAGIDYAIDDKVGVEFGSDRYEAYISLSQSLFNNSENTKKMKEAMTGLLIVELELEKQRHGLLLYTIERYFALLSAQRQLKSGLSMIEKSNRNYKEINTKYNDGLASALEVLQAEINHSVYELDLKTKRNSLEYAAMALSTVMGLPVDTKIRAVDVDYSYFFKIDWERCYGIAIQKNIELKIYQKTLEQLKKFHKLAKKARWPTLSLRAFILGEPENEDLYDEDANAGLMFTLSETLFDAGIISREIRQYKLEINKQKNLVKAFEKKLFSDLKLHYNSLNNSIEEFLQSKKRYDLARKLSKSMHRSYELGAISLKEKLDSDDIANKAEVAYTAALVKCFMAEYKLKLKMGLNPIENIANPNDSSKQGVESNLPPEANHNNKGKNN